MFVFDYTVHYNTYRCIRTLERALCAHIPRKVEKMKSISASIVILAAAVLISVGSHVPHHDTKLFVQVVGCGLGLAGLFVWYISLKEK